MSNNRYFLNFNGIRFTLALFVLISHVEELKYACGLPSILKTVKMTIPLGTVSVSLFFALSGFLISYFLFAEKNEKKDIHVFYFYRNRILRIWPLYFLILFVHWYLLPNSIFNELVHKIYSFKLVEIHVAAFYFSNWLLIFLCIFLLPQLALAANLFTKGSAFNGAHIWSIGVEEIFYLFWPLILKYSKNFKRTILRLIVGYYFTHILIIILLIINKKTLNSLELNTICMILFTFLGFTRITCMFIGAIGAYLLFSKNDRYLKKISKKVALFAFAIMLILWVNGIEFIIFVHEMYALCFTLILVYLAQNEVKIKFFENKIMNYFGKISYGIYMYHIIAIIISIYTSNLYKLSKNSIIQNIQIYILSITITLVIATISYELFEKRILKLKVSYKD